MMKLLPAVDAIADYAVKQWEVGGLDASSKQRLSCSCCSPLSRQATRFGCMHAASHAALGQDTPAQALDLNLCKFKLAPPHLLASSPQGLLEYLLDPVRQRPPSMPIGLVRRAGGSLPWPV